jgi:hypothetical protein
MDNLPKGKANEVSGDGRKANPIGLYFHPEAKVWMDAKSVPHADAFVRLGYTLANAEQKKFVEAERAKLKTEEK